MNAQAILPNKIRIPKKQKSSKYINGLQKISMITIEIKLSQHGAQRGQKRGIPTKSIVLAARFGKKRPAKFGRYQRTFTKACMEKAQKCGFAIQDIEVARGVTVICDESVPKTRTVVSVLPKK